MIKKTNIEKYLQRKDSTNSEITGLPLVVLIEKNQTDTNTHTHCFTEMVIILSGTGLHQCNGQQRVLSRGDFFIIPKGCSHCYKETKNLMLANILFDLNCLPIPFMDMYLLPGFHELFPEKENISSSKSNIPGYHLPEFLTKEIEPLLNDMAHESADFTPGRDFRMLSTFMLILSKLISNYPSPVSTADKNFPSYQLSAVIGFLNREFRNHITLSDILKKIPMSRSTLTRNFIRAFDMTPMRYLNKLRLNHAAELLTSTTLSIGKISEKSGFTDSNYFTRVFRAYHGMTPSAWRTRKQ